MRITPYLLDGLFPLDHMSIENVLLETWESPEGLLLFYINGPSVIIGRNQNPWREAAPCTGLPLYRRASGGGAVYHDEGNLNWALIVPRLLHSQDAELAMVVAALSALFEQFEAYGAELKHILKDMDEKVRSIHEPT